MKNSKTKTIRRLAEKNKPVPTKSGSDYVESRLCRGSSILKNKIGIKKPFLKKSVGEGKKKWLEEEKDWGKEDFFEEKSLEIKDDKEEDDGLVKKTDFDEEDEKDLIGEEPIEGDYDDKDNY